MIGTAPLPSLETIKDQAKRLRSSLATQGSSISHSKALELVAGQYGYRDWNTLAAAAGNRPPTLVTGSRVRGFYLGQAFEGEVIAVRELTSSDGLRKITLHFDEPVDVVTFDSFSAFRRRVSAVIDEDGRSPQRTSNGRPHLELH